MDPRERLIDDLLQKKRQETAHKSMEQSIVDDNDRWRNTEELVRKLLEEKNGNAHKERHKKATVSGGFQKNPRTQQQQHVMQQQQLGGSSSSTNPYLFDPTENNTYSSRRPEMDRFANAQMYLNTERQPRASSRSISPRVGSPSQSHLSKEEQAVMQEAERHLERLNKRNPQKRTNSNPPKEPGQSSSRSSRLKVPRRRNEYGQNVSLSPGTDGSRNIREGQHFLSNQPHYMGPTSAVRSKSAGNPNGSIRKKAAEVIPRHHIPDIPLEERATVWAQQYQRNLEKRARAKEEVEQEKLKECTFHPGTKSPTKISRAQRKKNLEDSTIFKLAAEHVETKEERFERLHHEADQRAKIRAKAKSLLEDYEVQDYTFQPFINERTPGIARKARTPLRERVNEIQKKKVEQRLQKQMEVEVREDATFKPKLSATSERMVARKREEALRMVAQGQDVDGEAELFIQPANERLYQIAKEKSKNTDPVMHDYEVASHHKIAPKTNSIVQNSVFFQGPCADFIVRQQTFEDARNQRRELRRKIAEQDVTFHPTISKVSEVMARSNHERLGETAQARVERLSKADAQRRKEMREKLSEEQLKNCTFQPQINPVSKHIVGMGRTQHITHKGKQDQDSENTAPLTARSQAMTATSQGGGGFVHHRLYNEAKERLNANQSEIIEEENKFKEKYTFKPKIRSTPTTKQITESYISPYCQQNQQTLTKRITEEQKIRDLELEQRRVMKEEENLAGCTFKPKKGKQPPSQQHPVIVNGLSKFLETKEAARKKAEDERLAQEMAWGGKTKGLLEKRCGGVTIPVPFALSGSRDGRRTLRAEQDSQQRMSQYTFQPQTIEGSRAEKLQAMMDGNYGEGMFHQGEWD